MSAQETFRSFAHSSLNFFTQESPSPASVVGPDGLNVNSADRVLTPDASASNSPDRGPFKVVEIQTGELDSTGARVAHVYAVKDDLYAIYFSHRMMVHYADDRNKADEQRTEIAKIAKLRAHLEFLIRELECVEYYRYQLATALQLALDGKAEAAKEVIAQAVTNAEKERASRGRIQYLLYGFVTSLVFLGLLVVGHQLAPSSTDAKLLWLAAIGGTIGAFFSASVSIHSHTVALDLYPKANIYDGILRILIGLIAAAALTLLLAAGILPELKMHEVAITGLHAKWEAILMVGFIAGFLERLLPNLLEGRQGISSAVTPASS